MSLSSFDLQHLLFLLMLLLLLLMIIATTTTKILMILRYVDEIVVKDCFNFTKGSNTSNDKLSIWQELSTLLLKTDCKTMPVVCMPRSELKVQLTHFFHNQGHVLMSMIICQWFMLYQPWHCHDLDPVNILAIL